MTKRNFNEIYLGMRDRVYRLAAGITGSREDAEDVVQDLYERLWQRRAAVAEQRNPEGYVLTAARNLCLDRLRGRRRTVEVPPAMAARAENGHGEDNMVEVVRELMAALPEKQRTAMHLRDIECMGIDEIANVMGIAETAVRMSLSRARGTVKDGLVKIMNHGT